MQKQKTYKNKRKIKTKDSIEENTPKLYEYPQKNGRMGCIL